MYKDLRKLFENKKNGTTKCQKIVGSDQTIKDFAIVWQQHKDDLMLVAAGSVHKYIEAESPTKEQLVAYKSGLAEVALFFQECYNERKEKEERLHQASLKNEV